PRPTSRLTAGRSRQRAADFIYPPLSPMEGRPMTQPSQTWTPPPTLPVVATHELTRWTEHRAHCGSCTWYQPGTDVWSAVVTHIHNHAGHTIVVKVRYESMTRVGVPQ